MPELDDLAGSVVAAFLCFLWVDFIEPLESDFMESLPVELLLIEPPLIEPLLVEPLLMEPLLPFCFIESLLVWVCEPVVEAGVGDAACEAFWAMAAPPKAIQPATIATISFVLRMTNLLNLVAPWGKHRDARRVGIAHR
jgi:hypothetical protein